MHKTVFTSLIALAVATPLHAQMTQTEKAASGDEIVVTGTRAIDGVRAASLGSSVTVIDNEALQQRQTRVISDVLRDVPGLAVSRTGAAGALTQVRMRGGEGNHTLVLIDGIKASDPFQGEFDFATLIADDGGRIEVIRGQQSALYGSDAIGGVIHYITASGREKEGFSGRAEYGTQNTLSGAVRAGGVLGDSFDYAVNAAYHRTDGYPVAVGGVRDIGSENIALSTKLNWTPTENFRIQAVGRYTRMKADNTGSSPVTFAPIDGTASTRNRAFMGLLRAEFELLDGRWSHALTSQINDNKRVNFGGAAGTTRTSANEGQRLRLSYDTTLRIGTEAAQHSLTLAADYEREEFRNLPPAGPQPLATKKTFENRGLVAEYRFTAKDWLSVGGAIRHDDNDFFKNATTYRLSAAVTPIEVLRLRAAYGTGVKNPTPFELFGFANNFVGNANLKPERSKGWEAGLDFLMPGEDVKVGVTYFKARLRDEIFSNFVAPNFTPGNRITDSTQNGVEVSIAAKVADWLRIDGSYTFLDAKENNVQEIRRAPRIASANVHVQPIEALGITGTVRYNGHQIDSNFTTLPGFPARVTLPAFTLVNLSVDYRLVPNVTLYGRVENLFDDRYEEVFRFVGQGRTASIGVKASF